MRGKKGTTSVKHDVKQYVRRVLHVLKGADEGSGTISGVALIAIVASRTTSGNGTRLESCAIEGEDAVVAVRADTQVPFAPWVVRQSRAGPITCD